MAGMMRKGEGGGGRGRGSTYTIIVGGLSRVWNSSQAPPFPTHNYLTVILHQCFMEIYAMWITLPIFSSLSVNFLKISTDFTDHERIYKKKTLTHKKNL